MDPYGGSNPRWWAIPPMLPVNPKRWPGWCYLHVNLYQLWLPGLLMSSGGDPALGGRCYPQETCQSHRGAPKGGEGSHADFLGRGPSEACGSWGGATRQGRAVKSRLPPTFFLSPFPYSMPRGQLALSRPGCDRKRWCV